MRYKKKDTDPRVKQRPGQTGIEANNSKRTKRFEINLTPQEWDALQQRASEAGSSSTALYARGVLLPVNHAKDQETKAEHKLRLQLLAALGKIGSNINQIARALNRLKIWNETTHGLFQEMKKIQEIASQMTQQYGGKK